MDEKFSLVEPLLQPVIDQAARGEFTVMDVREMASRGQAIVALVEGEDGPALAMAFEFVHYPQTLSVNIMALGGSGLAEAADEFWELFRMWCRSAGASLIEAACSEAMARMLKRHGFDAVYRVVRSEL